MIKKIIKEVISKTGYELVNKKKLTTTNLLGLKHLNINTIIDVGANRGQFLTTYLVHFPNANYFCFEPLSEEFRILQNLANKLGEKIVVVNSALGNIEGKIKFNRHEHSPSSSILTTTNYCNELFQQTKNQMEIEVDITTIDKYFGNILNEKHKNILLKIDVQGYELEVLRGAQKTLNMISACLLEINFTNLYNKQANFSDIYKLLNKMGFEYAGAMDQNFNNEGKLIFSDVLFAKEIS